MTIQLAPEVQALIAEIAERGSYADDSEVIYEALSEFNNRLKLKRLRELIEEGEADYARGDFVEVTPEFWDQLQEAAHEMVRLGLPIDPDVCP